MAGSPELLPIVEAESAGSATRLQLGPQCCCLDEITCTGIIWPRVFGVEFHGAVSDPGGDNTCPGGVDCSASISCVDSRTLTYQYAPELFDWFGTPIEVQFYEDLADCIWCLPVTSDYTLDPSHAGTAILECGVVTPGCKGIVELGSHTYGYHTLSTPVATEIYDCAGSPLCTGDGTLTTAYTVTSVPHLMDTLQVAITVGGGNITVDVTFQTAIRQLVSYDAGTESCFGIVAGPAPNSYVCRQPFLKTLTGSFSRTFTGASSWGEIVNEQIPGTITGIDGATSCGAALGDYGWPNSYPCGGAMDYKTVGDYKVPRADIADAYCVLRSV